MRIEAGVYQEGRAPRPPGAARHTVLYPVVLVGRLEGKTIIAFESRRATEFERLLSRHGGEFVSAPALREVPLSENPAAWSLLEDLEANRIDAVLLLTGVGTRALVDAVASRCERERFAALLGRVPLLVRGPKPAAALRELGLEAQLRAPEPNTWREILAEIDRSFPVEKMRIAVQEYGRSNTALLDGLRERGATPVSVPVYRWALPEDITPLKTAIERILRGDFPIVAFTTAVQLDHLLQVAGDRSPELVEALRSRSIVASIGPSATEALREQGISPQIEPTHPKLGYLASAIAEQAGAKGDSPK